MSEEEEEKEEGCGAPGGSGSSPLSLILSLRGTTHDVSNLVSSASSMFPGFRFSPTDHELISYYLKNKIDGRDSNVQLIPEIDICKSEPWDLPGKSIIDSENEWFFFSPRGRKYPNGAQSKRATQFGYWKATGKERHVKSCPNNLVIGTKRTLVFHTGRAPKGQRTEWIMHEYSMPAYSQDSLVVCRLRKNSDFRLNDAAHHQPSLPINHNHNHNTSTSRVQPVCLDQSALSEGGDTPVDSSSRKCSSRYGSHSIELIDSDFDHQLTNEVSQPNSSTPPKDCDDDFYAEILNDDIIKLDDASLGGTSYLPPNMPNIQRPEHRGKQPMQPSTATHVSSFQGTANRRIRLKKREVPKSRAATVESFTYNRALQDEKPKCVLSMFSSKFRNGSRGVYIVLVLVGLVFLCLCYILVGTIPPR